MMKYRGLLCFALVVVVLLVISDTALAEQVMPYEKWLVKFKKSVTGPVAAALIIIGIVGAGAMLVWGGEIGTFLKSMIYLTLVACFLVGSSKLLTGYFEGKDTDGFSLFNLCVTYGEGAGIALGVL